MADGLRESSSWSRQEDRDWIRWAAVDATVAREQAEASLAEGRALLARIALIGRRGSGAYALRATSTGRASHERC
jgi:hypothetical protein